MVLHTDACCHEGLRCQLIEEFSQTDVKHTMPFIVTSFLQALLWMAMGSQIREAEIKSAVQS